MKRSIKIILIGLSLLSSFVFSQPQIIIEETLKREALEHMQAGRYGEAIDQLNKYIAQNAQDPGGYHLRGLCREAREEYQWAVLDLRRANRLDPNDAEIRKDLQRVRSTWDAILYERIEGFERELAIDPSDPIPYLEIGKSYRWLEEWSTAELWYDRYLERDPDAVPDEIIRYTEILSHTGSIRKGERKLEEYVERYPDDWRLWSRYGYFTMWLGNYRNAERAFRTALSIKPFFKEAQDGLDLALQEGYLTQFRPRSYEREEYPIDRYYRQLKNDPNNDEARYQLIELLLDENRFDEAFQQLQYLAPNYEGTDRFEELRQRVLTERETYYNNEIEIQQAKLKENPENGEAALAIAQNYANMEDYESAAEILREYLEFVPDDIDARLLLAKVLAYDRRLDDAYEEINIVLDERPDDSEVQLLFGQICVWRDDNLEEAEEILEDVLEKNHDNLNALITLGTLNFQQHEYETAQQYNMQALTLAPDNPDAQQLNSMLELHFIRVEEERKLEKLEQGRELAMNGDYEAAIPYYEEYFDEAIPTTDLKYELADVYTGAGRFSDAIDMYDEVLTQDYRPEYDIQRAKVLYWNGDSLRALDEFERLHNEYPDDREVSLYLGDSYTKMKMYDEARAVYSNILDEDASYSDIIKERISWLPQRPEDQSTIARSFRYLSTYLLSYMTVQPISYYFADDLDFEYYYYGSNLETSILPYISGGVTWLRGNMANEFGDIDYSMLKGNIFLRPEDNLIFSLSYGRMYSAGAIDRPVFDAGLRYEIEDRYKIGLNYIRSDAATILYSPQMVFTRLTGEMGSLDAYYKFENSLKFSLLYQLIYTHPGEYFVDNNTSRELTDNIGNNFQLRVGREFTENVFTGFEYYFSDFKYRMPVYYSPQNYHQYSIFADWKILEDEYWDISLFGKVGYVPQSDYIIRALSGEVLYSLMQGLRLSLNFSISNTFREQAGYTSGSIYFSALWSLY